MTTQRLWAPWRLDYILKPKGDECFLCQALGEDHDRENLILTRGTHCAIFINRYPYNNGHLMICPISHKAKLTELSDAEKLETMNLVTRATQVLETTMHPQGFNVGMNLGKVAGAGLDNHLHTHVVPRWNGDTNFMPVLDNTRVIPQSLLNLWDQLRPEFE